MRQMMNENWKFVKYAENMSEAVGAAGEHCKFTAYMERGGRIRTAATIITAASVGM